MEVEKILAARTTRSSSAMKRTARFLATGRTSSVLDEMRRRCFLAVTRTTIFSTTGRTGWLCGSKEDHKILGVE